MKATVAYEKPSTFHKQLRAALVSMGSGEPDATIDSESEYIAAAQRAGMDPVATAGIIYRTHKNPVGAACPPPPAANRAHLEKAALAATPENRKSGTRVLYIDKLIAIESMSDEELNSYAKERGVVEARDCSTFTRVERDPEKFAACLARAKEIGQMSDSENVYKFVKDDMNRETQEVFMVIGLSTQLDVISYDMVAKGQVDRVAVNISDVLRPVIANGAKAFIVCHNHPSGDAHPSKDDQVVTDKIVAATALMTGLQFLDHLVIGMGQFYSFTDKKLVRMK